MIGCGQSPVCRYCSHYLLQIVSLPDESWFSTIQLNNIT